MFPRFSITHKCSECTPPPSSPYRHTHNVEETRRHILDGRHTYVFIEFGKRAENYKVTRLTVYIPDPLHGRFECMDSSARRLGIADSLGPNYSSADRMVRHARGPQFVGDGTGSTVRLRRHSIISIPPPKSKNVSFHEV